jgi:hypothetical protein
MLIFFSFSRNSFFFFFLSFFSDAHC